eukprot:g27634.t1
MRHQRKNPFPTLWTDASSSAPFPCGISTDFERRRPFLNNTQTLALTTLMDLLHSTQLSQRPFHGPKLSDRICVVHLPVLLRSFSAACSDVDIPSAPTLLQLFPVLLASIDPWCSEGESPPFGLMGRQVAVEGLPVRGVRLPELWPELSA